MSIKEQIAIEAGLSFQRELIKQSELPLTGATPHLRRDIEAIDPKAWETICYAVSNNLLSLLEKEVDKKLLTRFPCCDCNNPFYHFSTDVIEQAEIKKMKPCTYQCSQWQTWIDQSAQLKAVKDMLKE
jgi:hypothetical protein